MSKGDQKSIDEKMKFEKEKLEHGPVAERGKKGCCCTFSDLWFAPIFIAAMVAMVCCAIFGWSKGNPDQLFIGWDVD